MATQDECPHEHVEDFVVDDSRLGNPTHQVRYLKCADCGLLAPDPEGQA
ncbi:MAG: hypothetical protein H0U61_03240 [Nocardioidaceae bacterium]|nr:hypothetical protein [Nocardioidaceae bacterium]